MLPKVIINYKTYDEALGEKGLELSRIAKEVEKTYNVKISVMPLFVDLRANSEVISVYAQTLEKIESGAHTGHITLNQIIDAGAEGVVLNHSEKRIPIEEIKEISRMAKANGLEVIVCAENAEEASRIDEIKEVDAIALEPRELIGSGRAVSKEKPEEIVNALELIKKPLYVGAGITSKEDVGKSIELGAYGILVASAIVKAEDRKAKVEELASPFKNLHFSK